MWPSPSLSSVSSLRERLDRVAHGAAEIAGVHVGRRPVDGDLPMHEAAQRRRKRRHVLGKDRGVGDDRHVARQPVAMLGEKRLEVRRADLFLALDDDLHVERQCAAHAQVRLDRGEVHEHLALVVDAAAPVELAVADLRVERRRRPKIERVDRLDVVVAVDHDRRLAGRAEPLAVGDRVAAGLDHFCALQARAEHPARQVLGAAAHVAARGRMRRDRRNRDQVLELAEKALAVGAGVRDQRPLVVGAHAKVCSRGRRTRRNAFRRWGRCRGCRGSPSSRGRCRRA